MSWLLAQIALLLLLAALGGWYVGWCLRGFRDGDRVEDLRQTLAATVDVKDREISDSNRRIEMLESRNETLQRDRQQLSRHVDEVSAERPDPTRVGHGSAVAVAEQKAIRAVQAPANVESLDDARELRDARTATEAERQRRMATDDALRAKAEKVLALESQVASLQTEIEEKATALAQLEDRIVELEPAAGRVAELEGKLQRLQTGADALRTAEEQARRDEDGRIAQIEELQQQLQVRDIRINQLRNRYNDAVAELEKAQSTPPPVATGAPVEAADADEDQLAEARRALQRQIERNRKQETVHRSVVGNLQHEIEHLRQVAARAEDLEVELERTRLLSGSGDARWRRVLADRDSQIADYRRRLADMERQRHPARDRSTDDLSLIRGIGAKFEARLHEIGISRFAEIAEWSLADVDQVAGELGIHAKRILQQDWIGSAKTLAASDS